MNKKSKIVTIGLLAISLAACHKHKKKLDDWDSAQSNSNYYVNDGTGFHQGGISPIWIYWLYSMNSRNNLQSTPGYVYRSSRGEYTSSFNGSRTLVSGRSVARGGFGSSVSHAGA